MDFSSRENSNSHSIDIHIDYEVNQFLFLEIYHPCVKSAITPSVIFRYKYQAF
jgi:hypothetical protein